MFDRTYSVNDSSNDLNSPPNSHAENSDYTSRLGQTQPTVEDLNKNLTDL